MQNSAYFKQSLFQAKLFQEINWNNQIRIKRGWLYTVSSPSVLQLVQRAAGKATIPLPVHAPTAGQWWSRKKKDIAVLTTLKQYPTRKTHSIHTCNEKRESNVEQRSKEWRHTREIPTRWFRTFPRNIQNSKETQTGSHWYERNRFWHWWQFVPIRNSYCTSSVYTNISSRSEGSRVDVTVQVQYLMYSTRYFAEVLMSLHCFSLSPFRVFVIAQLTSHSPRNIAFKRCKNQSILQQIISTLLKWKSGEKLICQVFSPGDQGINKNSTFCSIGWKRSQNVFGFGVNWPVTVFSFGLHKT